jgi:maltose alpha-D-glucosyltransferase / alpha-amylase
MLCVANLSRLAQHVELDLREHQGVVPVEVFGQTRFAPIRDHDYQITLAPYGFFWLSLVGGPRETATTALPTLPGTMTEVLRRRAGLGRALERWLPHRRWYAGKGRTIRSLDVDDAFALDDNVALLVVSVSFTEGDDQRYAVPVMRIGRELAEVGEHQSSAIAQLDDGALLVDAMSDQRGAAAVIGTALRRRTRSGRHGDLQGLPRRTRLTKLTDDPRKISLLGVEQSNSSVIIDGRFIAKLVRRLEAGLNPDVELPDHLRRSGFDAVPGVAANAVVDVPGESAPADVVIVHDAIAHESDLWKKVLDDLGLAIDMHAATDERGDDTIAGTLAELVGRRTAELHRSLGRPDGPAQMQPESFTLLWQRSLLQTLRNGVKATQRDVRRARRAGGLDEGVLEHVERLAAGGDEIVARFDRLRSEKLDAKRIRIHGDLHLGQILWTGSDVVFIDFEGEPGAPMAQRTIKRSPLADVAGLVRSFDYAGRMAVHRAVERGRVGEGDQAAVGEWRRHWTAAVTQRLLGTYFDGMDDSGLIPAADDDRRLLLEVYMLVKAMYEVRYELSNRPDWVAWPMSAIVDLLDAGRP